ncbi:hypothetical protein EDC01DRAFT_467745 [Geopyxis carbonaria]|nr:hypothetical protein EDC01DRAFT_467745 [Geopyxis carbonaria]
MLPTAMLGCRWVFGSCAGSVLVLGSLGVLEMALLHQGRSGLVHVDAVIQLFSPSSLPLLSLSSSNTLHCPTSLYLHPTHTLISTP